MAKPFSAKHLQALEETKYLKVRAGDVHRFINVWVVVVDGRVFARSWNDKPGGWYRAFLEERRGALQLEGTEVPVAARGVKASGVLDAVTDAFGKKYTTKANARYVRGFAEPARRANTIEFLRE